MTPISKILIWFFLFNLVVHAQSIDLPQESSYMFTGSGNCNSCHISSSGGVLIDSSGNDLTPSKDWRSTMMANAARDPYWLAKVEAEVNEHPHLKEIIEDKCSTCHMPMGRTQAIADGAEHYSITEGLKDPLAMDGVSCSVCHQIQPTNLGEQSSFSGGYIIDSSRVIYGPYENIKFGLMESSILYTPKHGAHMISSELCATCHTLYTNYVDDQGEIAGTFPEQMPYFEWKASSYAQNDIRCQSCHVPQVNEDIVISKFPINLHTQNPLYKHQFVGGNTFMLNMLKENGEQIGVTASATHFDSTIAHTRKQLRERTVNLTTTASKQDNLLEIDVSIENITGHKFPTGYPGRRAWLHVIVTNSQNDTIFESGSYNKDGTINHEIENYSNHADTINNEKDTQIYEAVMGDINGAVTKTLLRAASYLKDNRIPPKGFSSSAERYDDIAIRGLAINDSNFNFLSNARDNIKYLVDVTDQTSDNFTINVELLYQSVNPADISHFRQFDTEKVTTFLGYYDNTINVPEIIASDIIQHPAVVKIANHSNIIPGKFILYQNFPNPFNPKTVISYELKVKSEVELSIYNILGEKIATLLYKKQSAGKYQVHWDASSLAGGAYLYRLQANDFIQTKKMILIK